MSHLHKGASRRFDLVDALVLAVLTCFLLSFFDVRLMAVNSVPAGGDMASWYGEASHLAEVLLPAGRLTGWDMGHFAGQPAFQFYFLPPFLLAVVPSVIFDLPLAVCLKAAMVIGMLLFPVSVYACLRMMRCVFPTPLTGSALALVLLMNEGQTMFGGNALSTLAGEFCYMTAFTLLPLFVGRFYRDAWQGRLTGSNGILLGLVGLCHPFIFLPALAVLLYGFMARVRPTYLLMLGLSAAATMAFWLLPLLALRGLYTTPIDMVWREFDTMRSAATAFLMTCAVLAVPLCRRLRDRSPSPSGAIGHFFLWGLALTGAALAGNFPAVSPFGPALAGAAVLALGYTCRHHGGFDALCRWVGLSAGALLAAGAGWVVADALAWSGHAAALLIQPIGRYLLAGAAAAVVVAAGIWQPAKPPVDGWAGSPARKRLGTWLALLAGGGIAYGGAYFLRVPDIRFLPVCVFALGMVAATEIIGPLMTGRAGVVRILGAVTVCGLALLVSAAGAPQAGLWYRYNYRGFEQAPGWPEFAALNRYLRANGAAAAGDPLNAGRVGYEKSDLYGAYGGDRAFESLPYFSGRATLEGIHYAGALGARCVALVQSTYSRDLKTPEPLVLARLDAEAAAAYCRLYNVSQLVVASDEAKAVLGTSAAFSHEAAFGLLSVFRTLDSGAGYVEVPDVRPLRYTGKDWRDAFYRWCTVTRQLGVLMVADDFISDPQDRADLAEAVADPEQIERFQGSRLPSAGARVQVFMDHHRIRFSTNRVGVPHLVKVSYFPNWRVTGANGVYPVSPHFMLVIPRQSTVVLSYGSSPWEIAGLILTVGWLLGFAAMALNRLRGMGPIPALERFRRPARGAMIGLDRCLGRSRHLTAWALVVLAVAVAASGIVLRNRPVRSYTAGNAAFSRGLDQMVQGERQAAKDAFQNAVAHMAPLLAARHRYRHRDVVNCMLLTAASLENLGDGAGAANWYHCVLREFPYSRYVVESHRRLGRLFRARAAASQAPALAARLRAQSHEHFQRAASFDPTPQE